MEITTVPVRVAGELVISVKDLPQMALEQIKAALSIENEERAKLAGLNKFGWWDLPAFIPLWRIEERRGGDKVICLPRGFATQLVGGLAGMGLSVAWEDKRTTALAAPGYYKQILLRDYQLAAAKDMLKSHQGVYKCPAGGGKTVTTLGAAAFVQQRALIIVDKVGLANQWRVRAHEFYGMQLDPVEHEDGTTELVAKLTKPGRTKASKEGDRTVLREVGLIGNDVWEERDMTICLRQTLAERAWQLDATGWWQKWGLVYIDEVHHAAAVTLADITRKVTSFYFGGVSATPSKSEIKGQIINALVGPIIHETTRQTLYDRQVLMKASVEVLAGDFYADFWPDHNAEYDKELEKWKCLMPGCKKNGKHSHRNNYQSVLKKLVEDKSRNERIGQRVNKERGHVHLMHSRQLKHLELMKKAIVAAGWPKDKVWMLRGEENAAGLDQTIAQAIMAADEGVVLSTVADEALDIPAIDRVHLTFPGRDRGATIQIIGRGERVFPPKKIDAVAIDYREPRVDVFEGQWSERDTTYRMEGFDIVKSPDSVPRENYE